MQTTYNTEYLDNKGEWQEVEIEISFSTSRDGIGPYEYWGFKGFDKGNLCIDISSIDYNKTSIPSEDMPLIQAVIEKEMDNIYSACESELKSMRDCKDEYDYDLWKESQL